ncbi:uncharacterized protein [Rhodnius prolixus]|uniref:uncharacterized protein n=1 Tax=Rhodnius prolixus TaxID=13249 RepID=UPI003D18BA67
MRVFYAVSLLMLISAQVNSSPETLDKADKNFEEGFEKLTNEITESQNYGAKHSPAEQTELLQCYIKRLVQLNMQYDTSFHDFFHCVRMKQGFKKIGEMLIGFFEIGIDTVNTMHNMVLSCVDTDSVTGALCLIHDIIDFLTDFKSYVRKYEKNAPLIRQWAKDVTEMFNYCAQYQNKEFYKYLSYVLKQTDVCYSY